MLANILNSPVAGQELAWWTANNAEQHFAIINAIRAKYGVSLREYVLDPVSPTDFTDWLWRHQYTHNDMNAVLGIDGNDLSTLDLNNALNVQQWTFLHFTEHYQAAKILKIG